MYDLVREINKRLNFIDFDELWRGFTRYDYAIYDNENAYFSNKVIPVDNRFLGNTSIEYEGRYIAIWRVNADDIKNVDFLTASLIHEMYHAHQFTLKEKRFFNDIDGLKYPYDIENYKLRYAERLFLVKALKEIDINKKERMFNKFALIRQKREKIINDFIYYEKAIETVEGCAEYVSLKALKVISDEDFAKKIDNICDSLSKRDASVFDTRTLSYYSGALTCLVCDQLGKDIYDIVGECGIYLFDRVFNQVYENIWENGANTNFKDYEFEQLFNKYLEDIKRNINSVVHNENARKVKGEFIVCGYDPMNMVRYDNMVLHKRFVFIYDGNDRKFIKGPVVTISKGEDYGEVKDLIIID